MESSARLIKKALRNWPLHIHEALSSHIGMAHGQHIGSSDEQRKTVFVGMSGGVDSSVSAYLLKEAGFNVVGVFIKTWQPSEEDLEGGTTCTWKDDRRDAMRVCAHLGIPFRTLDLEEAYKTYVADYMIREYAAGRTPNPDIMCNKHVKFGGFFRYAMEQGADFVATGHYAQTRDTRSNKKIEQNVELILSEDENKDQTYFLWAIPAEILPKTIFPVGGLQKEEVRIIAEHAQLPVFDKKDSQGVCFIGMLDMKAFLKNYLKPAPVPGDVCNMKGETIGRHEGVALYTIGERHGFTILNQTTDAEPQFIIRKDMATNTLYVGKHSELIKSSDSKEIMLGDINFLSNFHQKTADQGKISAVKVKARLRHRQPLQDAMIKPRIDRDESATAAGVQGNGIKSLFGLNIVFEEPQQGIASGQSCVFYDGDVCLGGGIILG